MHLLKHAHLIAFLITMLERLTRKDEFVIRAPLSHMTAPLACQRSVCALVHSHAGPGWQSHLCIQTLRVPRKP